MGITVSLLISLANPGLSAWADEPPVAAPAASGFPFVDTITEVFRGSDKKAPAAIEEAPMGTPPVRYKEGAKRPSAMMQSGQPGTVDTSALSPSTPPMQALTDIQMPRPIDLTAPASDVWQRIRNGFAVPNLDSPLVAEKQGLYVARPQQLKIMFERASLYLYYITEQCERRGLPTELALLPFIESAFNPHAMSPARASGLWQFIPSTGRSYGLKQDSVRDERRDILASTGAALDYLTTLYEMYGDWYLALASYNWGEGSVARAIDRNRSQGLPTDYLSLSMPDETRNYVPKLQAIKNIINSPAAFNISLPQLSNEPYFTTVVKPTGLDIKNAAKMADMSIDEFKALNPSFNKPQVRQGEPVTVLVPTSKVDLFLSNLDKNAKAGDSDAFRLDENVLSGRGVGLKGRISGNTGILNQQGGDGSTLPTIEEGQTGLAIFRDPYQYEKQATQLSQANPLAEIKRYQFEEPMRRAPARGYGVRPSKHQHGRGHVSVSSKGTSHGKSAASSKTSTKPTVKTGATKASATAGKNSPSTKGVIRARPGR